MTRIAVLGGPYANPYALQATLADAQRRSCERIFCLGDLGGFGAECDAVWPLLLDNDIECIAGNYDVAIGRGDPDCGCGYADERDNHYAQLLYDYTLEHTSAEFAAWMRTLETDHRETIGGVDVHMVHGSPLQINDFMWESLHDDELRERLAASGADVLLCTHTGIPWQRRIDGTLVVNVGVVGRPANDGRTDAWYAVLDLDAGSAAAELIGVEYDWRAQAASMRAAGLPEPFVETIETGWWTTCLEIVPPFERARGRFHLYRAAIAALIPAGELGWADGPELAPGERPVVELFGTAAFPARLWLYTNFHCNLACDYCVVASSPRARRRSLGPGRVRELVDEATAEGFSEIYLTGGEPFLEPDIVAMLEYCSERLPTVVLTNATVFTGRRRHELARLAGHDQLVIQTSLDGATAGTHDAWRGSGSFTRALSGIAYANRLGLPVRVAMTETPDNRHEIPELRRMLEHYGVTGDAFAVRPLVRRGFAAELEDASEFDDSVVAPELTVTADGIHWHPLGGDLDSSPDMLVAPGQVSLADAKRLVTERFLRLRQADGSLPAAFRCAV
ncbi:radical SAM protein [Conexibacter sp. DBS9H8]|uniref:radical SAM protein n=1 Tax=Conexibacter sp. DBS9H8 TaxID=2937801 RepID=UPI00200C9612|nr:radical SAM protein [Conexibacter sp. DBS9H8]